MAPPKELAKTQPQAAPTPAQQPPPVTKFDLLSLKKQVMDEIRQELENEAREKQARDERAYQALQAQREKDLQKERNVGAG